MSEEEKTKKIEEQEQAAQENVEQEEVNNDNLEAGDKEASEPEKHEPTPEEIIAELNDKYLRLRADFDNYRKRMAREANETRERAKINVVSEFLPVYDFFSMAMISANQTDDMNAIKQGMQMILNEFKRAFDGLGLQELKAEGEKFDPNLHEAARTEVSDTVPEGIILKQWKAGYKMGEKLVRPAMVVVSAGPEKPKTVEPEPVEADEADEARQDTVENEETEKE